MKKLIIKSIKIKKNYVLNKFSKKSNFFYNYLDKFLSLIPLKPEIVLYKTYFKKISNFKIFLKSSTIPRIYTEFEKKLNFLRRKVEINYIWTSIQKIILKSLLKKYF